jgi:Bacterial Ig-like domain (group 3)
MPQKPAILSLALLASLLSGLASSRATAASSETPAPTQPAASTPATAPLSPEEVEKRRAFNAEMARRPLPKNGCFHATYPNTEWQEVPCGRPSPYPNLVGNGADFVAVTSGLISSAEGSFLSPTSVSGETGIVAGTGNPDRPAYVTSNIFTLQINSQSPVNSLLDHAPFNTAACSGGDSGCSGWEQFVFSQTQGPPPDTSTTPPQVSAAPSAPVSTTPGLFVEYWLYGYGSPCPALPTWALQGQPAGTPWNSDGMGDCWFNGPMTYVIPLTAADFAPAASGGLTMTAKATATDDQVTLLTLTGPYAYKEPSVLGLSKAWTEAEFNVFGDGNGTEANFTSPTVLTVQAGIGATSAPYCLPSSGTVVTRSTGDGTTGEKNNLGFMPTTASVCCPYAGGSPAIEFLESLPSQNAWCGPTTIEGDPHLTTADGTHYDFQGAGEFVTLRDPDGMEVQTRQAPISTTFFPAPDAHDGLATCVSINTAVAAHVGDHRVTWEPNLSGVPDPSGLQLRIDGALTHLGPQGLALGAGGRVAPTDGGALQVDFPDGKTLLVTPQWWASQSKWYLNVDISHLGLESDASGVSARGIAGSIVNGSWLPALPNGASIGPMPATLPERYDILYEKFADAWRVTDKDSLFDYAPGTSTNTYTMKDWPKQNPPCVVRDEKPVEPASEAEAEAACRPVRDDSRHSDCVFDVRVTGNPGFAQTYLNAQRNLALSTTTSLTDGDNPSQPGEWVSFTAFVAPYATTATGLLSGTVQFAVDGLNAGEPITVDAKGRATWETSRLKVGTSLVTAGYVPGADSAFLPSTSLAKIHEVKRCPCEASQPTK